MTMGRTRPPAAHLLGCLAAVCWTLLSCIVTADEPHLTAAEEKRSDFLDAIPPSFHLQAYDDCGFAGRQPHVDMTDASFYIFQFPDCQPDENLQARSVVVGSNTVAVSYEDLDPSLAYVVAVTYASDDDKRIQSLWCDGVPLHGPFPLPCLTSVRVLVPVPPSAVAHGKLALRWQRDGAQNVVVSVVELWANAPPHDGDPLHITRVSGLFSSEVTGQLLDRAYNPVAGAIVELRRDGQNTPLATATSQAAGWFKLAKGVLGAAYAGADLQIDAHVGQRSASYRIPAPELAFDPVRYRPVPVKVAALSEHRLSLDGTWKLAPQARSELRSTPLAAPDWKDFRVPGQWRQQGFDLPLEQTVAVARGFTVPRAWANYRVFLRFDAIHGGTHYWINGHPVGRSENLYTPVEWEVTPWIRTDELNRLDLEMTVDTLSERLSHASRYAGHSLGGIDRAVSLYALPNVHVRALHLSAELDATYRDGVLQARITLDNGGHESAAGLTVVAALTAPDGQRVPLAAPRLDVGAIPPGTHTVDWTAPVPHPLKWTDETPHLYQLTLQLQQDDTVLECIARHMGFRKIEIRGSQFLVNGVPVKLAGACHHEVNPLAGRADTMHEAERDVRLAKAANLNLFRTSHYPPTRELVEAADRYGMYLEVEAPLCWVRWSNNWLMMHDEPAQLASILTSTSAMIDCYQSHPSVILWSLANESAFLRCFEISRDMVKQLDPQRPVLFNGWDPNKSIAARSCDILVDHYPAMPYDQLAQHDPRPLYLGEFNFTNCHQVTDVRINPGLLEMYGWGHSNPQSLWARRQAEEYTKPAILWSGIVPGAWSHIVHSDRVIGGSIWAFVDDGFFFSDRPHAGDPNCFWGIIDAWRRPKPEWWLCKLIYSPVWLPSRSVDYTPGQDWIELPVENRYAFTNLSDLTFSWQLGNHCGVVTADVPPKQTGHLRIPIPTGTCAGDRFALRVTDSRGNLVNAMEDQLGESLPVTRPQPSGEAPETQEVSELSIITGRRFALVFNRNTGDFVPGDPRHRASVLSFPTPHFTRYDFGDLRPGAKPYAVFPDHTTRQLDGAAVTRKPQGLEITVRTRYDTLAGSTTWLIDRNGLGTVRFDYAYTGEEMPTREAGLLFTLAPACDELRWNRWSEWGDVFPEDCLLRVQGTARAFRDAGRRPDPEHIRPDWPWSQDQTELGTADFRAVKFHIYDTTLADPDGRGLRVQAQGDIHVRCCMAGDRALLHVLSQCSFAQTTMEPGAHLSGEYSVDLAW